MKFLTQLKDQISLLLADTDLLLEVSSFMKDGQWVEKELTNLLSLINKQTESLEAQNKTAKTKQNPALTPDIGFLYGKFLVPLTIIQNKIDELIAKTQLAQNKNRASKLDKLNLFKNKISSIIDFYLKKADNRNKAIAAYLTDLVTEKTQSFNFFTLGDKAPLTSALRTLTSREEIKDKLYKAVLAQLNAGGLDNYTFDNYTFKRFLLTRKNDSGVDVKVDTISVQYAPKNNLSQILAKDCYHMILCNGNASFAAEMIPDAIKIARDLSEKLDKPIIITLFDYLGVLSSTYQSNTMNDLVFALETVVEFYQNLNVSAGRMILVGQSIGAAPATILAHQLHHQQDPYRVFCFSIRGFKNATAVGAKTLGLSTSIISTGIKAWDINIAPFFLEIREGHKYFFTAAGKDNVIKIEASLAQGIIDVMVPPKSSSNFMGSVSSVRTAAVLPIHRPKTIPGCKADTQDEREINQAIKNCTLIPNYLVAAADMHNANLADLLVEIDGDERNAYSEFINICVIFYKNNNSHEFQSQFQVANNNNNTASNAEVTTSTQTVANGKDETTLSLVNNKSSIVNNFNGVSNNNNTDIPASDVEKGRNFFNRAEKNIAHKLCVVTLTYKGTSAEQAEILPCLTKYLQSLSTPFEVSASPQSQPSIIKFHIDFDNVDHFNKFLKVVDSENNAETVTSGMGCN